MSLETRRESPQVRVCQFDDDVDYYDCEDGAYGVGISRKTKEP